MKRSIISHGLLAASMLIAALPEANAQSCSAAQAQYKTIKAWYAANGGSQPSIPVPPVIDPDCLDCSDPLQKDRNQPLIDTFNARSARPESDIIKAVLQIARAKMLAGDGGNVLPGDHYPETGSTCFSGISDMQLQLILKACEKRLLAKVTGMLDKYHGSPQYFLGGIQFYLGVYRQLLLLGYLTSDNALENEEFRSWASRYYQKYQDRLLKGFEYQLYPMILYMPRQMALMGFELSGHHLSAGGSWQPTDAGIDLINKATAFMHFKLKIRVDATGHADNGGLERCLLNGETEIFCQVSPGDDNLPCYTWVGVQGGNTMKFSVDEFQFQNKDGKLSYAGDKTFTNTFTLSIGLCEQNRLFALSFAKFGPQVEKLSATRQDGSTATLQNIDVIRNLYSSIMSEASNERFKNYEGQSNDLEALANRAQQHVNDKAYWSTPQGRSDAAKLRELHANFGSGPGAGAPDVQEGLSRIVAPFTIGSAKPVNYTQKAKLLTQHKGDSGSGWDTATITVTLDEMNDHRGDFKQ